MHSSHIFMFPFRYDYIPEPKHSLYELCTTVNYEVRVDEDNIIERLEQYGWKYEIFDPSKNEKNLFLYASFFPHVRDILFNTKGNKDTISYLFHKTLFEDKHSHLNIEIENRVFTLTLDRVALRMFDSGIGVLVLELSNSLYNKLDDITLINQRFRRSYTTDVHKTDDGRYRDAKAPTMMEIFIEGKSVFKYNYANDSLFKRPHVFKHLRFLLNEEIFTNKVEHVGKYVVKPLIGNKMFVLCHVVHNGIYEKYAQQKQLLKNLQWRKFVLMSNNDHEVESLNYRHFFNDIYSWTNNKTVFGLSKTSFVLISNAQSVEKYDAELKFHTIYMKLCVLLLGVRASVNKFTEEITSISTKCTVSDNIDNEIATLESIEVLYKFFLKFMNRLHFREIVADKDAEDVRKILNKTVKIEEKISFINNELKELYDLYNFTEIITAKNKEDLADKLSVLAGIFVPAGVLSGIYGMNIFDLSNLDWRVVVVSAVLTYALVVWFLIKPIKRSIKRFKDGRD